MFHLWPHWNHNWRSSLFLLITHSKHLFKFYFKSFPELIIFKYNKNKIWNSFCNTELFFISMQILLVVVVSLSKEFKKQGKLRLTWVLHIYISHSPSTVSFAFFTSRPSILSDRSCILFDVGFTFIIITTTGRRKLYLTSFDTAALKPNNPFSCFDI